MSQLPGFAKWTDTDAEQANASVKPDQFKDTATFKNFHRSLCERFGYVHDDQDWWRDLCSLEEHIAGMVTRQWLPIESAPREPWKKILGYLDGQVREAYLVDRDDCELWVFGGRAGKDTKPTHWMPLPQPPVTGSEGDGNANQA